VATAALIGCGDVSAIHLEAIAALDGIELAAVCDTDPDRLDAAAKALSVPGFADHRQLIDSVRPDVVHICTPHDQHAQVAIDCLEQGVHVITEKPLAHTVKDGLRLIEAAEQNPAKIAVCFQNRYNAGVAAIHRLLTSGAVGEVTGAGATVMWHRTAEYYRDRPWRGRWSTSGGGLLMNQAIHTVDLVQWLVGPVTRVRGHAATHLLGDVIEVEDTAEMVLDHANGARSVFYATVANTENAPVTLDIITERATLSLRGDLTVSYADGRVEVVPERRAASGGRSYWGVSHELLIRDFYDRLGDPEPFWISPQEAAKSLAIVKDVYAQSYPAFQG
jgi:UDP-N-acetyl-2-amino-2-deoxyglucuronate dehydrogenase